MRRQLTFGGALLLVTALALLAESYGVWSRDSFSFLASAWTTAGAERADDARTQALSDGLERDIVVVITPREQETSPRLSASGDGASLRIDSLRLGNPPQTAPGGLASTPARLAFVTSSHRSPTADETARADLPIVLPTSSLGPFAERPSSRVPVTSTAPSHGAQSFTTTPLWDRGPGGATTTKLGASISATASPAPLSPASSSSAIISSIRSSTALVSAAAEGAAPVAVAVSPSSVDVPLSTPSAPTASGISSATGTFGRGCVQRHPSERFLVADTCQWGQSNQLRTVGLAANLACALGRSLVEPPLCESMLNKMGTSVNRSSDYFDVAGSINPFFAECERRRAELGMPALAVPLRVVPLDEFPRLFGDEVSASGVDPTAVVATLGQRDYEDSPPPSAAPWEVPCVSMQVYYGFPPPELVGRTAPLLTRALNVRCSAAAFVRAPPAFRHNQTSMRTYWEARPDEWRALNSTWYYKGRFGPSVGELLATVHEELPFPDAPVVVTQQLFGQRIFPLDGLPPFEDGLLRPRSDIIAFAREIAAQLRPYVSAHLRLGDFTTSHCFKKSIEPGFRACGVNMTRAPEALVDAALHTNATAFLVASNGSPEELEVFERRVQELMPDLRLFRLSEDMYRARFNVDVIDPVMFALVEKMLLACGAVFYGSSGSTFSGNAFDLRVHMDECRNSRYLPLPPLYGTLPPVVWK